MSDVIKPSPKSIEISDVEQLKQVIESLISHLGEEQEPFRVRIKKDSEIGLHLKLDGDKYKSTITTPVIKALLETQKELTELYCEVKYGRVKKLTTDEKRKLELVTEVRPGSSDLFSLIADPINFILEILENSNMTPETTASVIITLIIVGGVVGISKSLIEGWKEKVKEQSRTTQSSEETKRLELVTQSLDNVVDYQKTFERRLAQTDAINIQLPTGEKVKPEELKERTRSERKKTVEKHEVIEDEFKVVKITIDHEADELFADAIRVSTGDLIPMINLQKNFKSEDLHTPVEKSVDKEPIRLQVAVHYRNDNIEYAYLSSVL